jgi:hypothetical protein
MERAFRGAFCIVAASTADTFDQRLRRGLSFSCSRPFMINFFFFHPLNFRHMLQTANLRLVLTIMLLTLSTVGWSQAKDPATKARERTEQMTKDLGLDAEQAARVDAVNLVHYQKLAEIKSSSADKDSKKADSKKAKATHRAALERVLTKEQFKRMEALQAERKAAKKAAKKASEAPGKSKSPSM